MSAPNKCPMCEETLMWKKVDTQKRFSLGKAVLGGIFLGPLGFLLGGALGKTKVWYACGKCGFQHEYNA